MSDERAIEVVVAAPADTAWRALRDPAEIRRWFGWEYDGLDAEIEGIFLDQAEASEQDRAIRWSHGDRFELEPRGPETVVRVTRAAQNGWDEIYEGWLTFAQQLGFALSRHPGEDRRTLYLSGEPPADGSSPPLAVLDLRESASTPVGHRYEGRTAFGEEVAGEVWFRSEHQTGLTVDGYGDGLLVLAEQPAAARPPAGGHTALITTYGLDDAALRALRDRWTGWWTATYREPSVTGG